MKARESGMPDEKIWQQFFDVNKIFKELEIDSNVENLVDFGFGYGTFTLPVSKIVSGKVYAFDIEAELVESLNEKIREKGYKKIFPVKKDFINEGTDFNDGEIDYVMLFNILHAEKSEEILKETYRVLNEKGKVGVIHWIYDSKTPRGPSMSIRPKPEEIKNLLLKNGFSILKFNIILPPYHYGILAVKE